MKLTINPTAKFKIAAETAINHHFSLEANEHIQRDHEHTRKREIAVDVVGAGGESSAPSEFVEEAALSGMTITQLATTILSKPDEIMARGLRRRKAILAVRAAKTADAIKAKLTEHGVSELHKDVLARIV
jgi:hypothetical protein